jgi:hypothetical protein
MLCDTGALGWLVARLNYASVHTREQQRCLGRAVTSRTSPISTPPAKLSDTMRTPDARLSLEDLEDSIAAALRGEVATCVWAGVDPLAEALDELAASPDPTADDLAALRALGVATIAAWRDSQAS